jgi:hypothetical protein
MQCNATKSTGPKTEAGRMQSRRNAVRHGLSAETVTEIVEDVEDYKGFEAAIIADYDAQTAVERELVLRLASLLWRLRRATTIETDLLSIQAGILLERRNLQISVEQQSGDSPVIDIATAPRSSDEYGDGYDPQPPGRGHCTQTAQWAARPISSARQLALCFQRLANLDNAVFERLGRYESALARQVVQTVFLLQSLRVR